MVKMIFGSSLILFVLFLLTACVVEKPEGPGEKIGKGVDQIMDGIDDYDSRYGDRDDGSRRQRQYGEPEPVPSYAARPDGGYVPECDPLYDPNCKSNYYDNRQKDERRY